MATTYGIISDIHKSDPRLTNMAISILKREGADALILNGDLIGEEYESMSTEAYLAYILEMAGRSGLETTFQPGSHEEFAVFDHVAKAMCSQFPNLIYAVESPKVEMDDHHLVFLPGSDVTGGNVRNGPFILGKTNGDSGVQRNVNGYYHFTNIKNLYKLVTEPDKTILVCHVPRYFGSEQLGVDTAFFAHKIKEDSPIPGVVFQDHLRRRFPAILDEQLAPMALIDGYQFKREHRGNTDLRDTMEEIGLTKGINGHFHESAHRAHDRQGQAIPEGEFGTELFWNASYLDGLKVGLLAVDGTEVAYVNVDLKPYVDEAERTKIRTFPPQFLRELAAKTVIPKRKSDGQVEAATIEDLQKYLANRPMVQR